MNFDFSFFIFSLVFVFVLLWIINYISTAEALEQYSFIRKWDVISSGSGEYDFPFGLAVDTQGNVYSTFNSAPGRILKFSSDGRLLTQWDRGGDGPFAFLNDVALDSSGRNLYVTESPSNFQTNSTFGPGDFRVQRFLMADPCPAGMRQIVSGVCFVSMWDTGNGPYRGPSGIDVDNSGNVYVVDGFNNRVQKFDSNGRHIRNFGGNPCYLRPSASSNCIDPDGSGTQFSVGDGQFGGVGMRDVTTDQRGDVYITDGWNGRVQKFDSDGRFLSKWGTSCEVYYQRPPHPVCVDPDGASGPFEAGDGQFNHITGISSDALGNLYVVDHVNNRIQKFDSDGRFISKWGTPCSVLSDILSPPSPNRCIDPDGASGPLEVGDGQFYLPISVDIDSSGNVYISDEENRRIQVFEKVPDPTPPETSLILPITDGSGRSLSEGDTTTSTSIQFRYIGRDMDTNDRIIGFECRLNNIVIPCTNVISAGRALEGTASFGKLHVARYVFEVRAHDSTDLADPTPARFTWNIAATPPNTRITQARDGDGNIYNDIFTTQSSSVVFNFEAIAGSYPIRGFNCILTNDQGLYVSERCVDYFNIALVAGVPPPPNSVNYTNLCGGRHTFSVSAGDIFDNWDLTPNWVGFIIDRPCTPIPEEGPGMVLEKLPPFKTLQQCLDYISGRLQAGEITEDQYRALKERCLGTYPAGLQSNMTKTQGQEQIKNQTKLQAINATANNNNTNSTPTK